MITFDWLPPTIETARLVIRPFVASDAPSLFRSASNPNVTRFTSWDYHRDLDESAAFIAGYATSQYYLQIPEPVALALRTAPDEVIGASGCFWANRDHFSMEIGYWLAEPYWGQGLAVEAARAMTEYVFATFAVERLQAHCVVANAASGRVLEKIGMKFEGVSRSGICLRGTFHDVKRYAILRNEWPAIPPAPSAS